MAGSQVREASKSRFTAAPQARLKAAHKSQTGLANRKGLATHPSRARLRHQDRAGFHAPSIRKSRSRSPHRCFSAETQWQKHTNKKCRLSGEGQAAFALLFTLFSGANSRPEKRLHRTVSGTLLLSKQEQNQAMVSGRFSKPGGKTAKARSRTAPPASHIPLPANCAEQVSSTAAPTPKRGSATRLAPAGQCPTLFLRANSSPQKTPLSHGFRDFAAIKAGAKPGDGFQQDVAQKHKPSTGLPVIQTGAFIRSQSCAHGLRHRPSQNEP